MLIEKFFQKFLFLILFLVIFISIFFIPTLKNVNIDNSQILKGEIIESNPNGFVWPIPGYNNISSYFGKRKAPTSGASSFHYGIDVPAPQGSKLIAVKDGEITFKAFLGAGGYTITLSFDNFKVSYCHVDPNFIVNVGDSVKQGQVIGYVGPKYVSGVPGNIYFDSTGKNTNGATTGCHLHLGIRVDNNYSNPLNYF